jgi:hypothetical protein
LAQAASATAKVHFIQDGGSFICSGTLLNDKGNTKTPWFATANHCIPDQATADTASFEWFFQATSCGGSATDSRHTQTYGGAQLLYTDFKFEASFLKLNKSPPSGVYFIGWDTSIRVGDAVWGVHHPEGDHTMVSKGTVTALLQTQGDLSQGGTHLLDDVTFVSGGTESGSSGSGLFLALGNAVYWRGTLFGGPVGNYQIGSYSHLQSYYNNIKQWLETTQPPVPAPTVLFTASQTTVNYLATVNLNWSSTNATSCSASISDGWSGGIPTAGSAVMTMTQRTTYTITCTGSGGQASKALTVSVNPPPMEKIDCLLDWAEKAYPALLAPTASTQMFQQYTYRQYRKTNAYAGISSVDNHVYYQGPDGGMWDLGGVSGWLTKASCQ